MPAVLYSFIILRVKIVNNGHVRGNDIRQKHLLLLKSLKSFQFSKY